VTSGGHDPRSPWIQGLWPGARVGSLSSMTKFWEVKGDGAKYRAKYHGGAC
jgi:hypothetical protein